MDLSVDIRANYAQLNEAYEELRNFIAQYEALQEKLRSGQIDASQLNDFNQTLATTYNQIDAANKKIGELTNSVNVGDGISIATELLGKCGVAADIVSQKMQEMGADIKSAMPKNEDVDTSAFEELTAQMNAVQSVAETLGTKINETVSALGVQKEVAEEASKTTAELATSTEDLSMWLPKINASTAKGELRELGEIVKEDTALLKQLDAEMPKLQRELSNHQGKKNELQSDNYSEQYRSVQMPKIDSKISEVQEQMQMNRQAAVEFKNEISACNQRMAELGNQAQQTATKTTSIRTQMRLARQQVAQMIMDGKQGSIEFGKAVNNANKLSIAFAKAGMAINGKTLGYNAFETLNTAIKGATGAMTTYMGIVGLFTDDQEKLQKVQKDLQAAMSISMGVQQLMTAATQINVKWNALKASALASVVAAEENEAIAATSAATAESGKTMADGAQVISAGAATTANWSLAASFKAVGLAIKSIPVLGQVLIAITAVASVVAGVVKGIQKLRAEAKATAEFHLNEQKKIAKDIEGLRKSWQQNDAKAHKKYNEEIASSVSKSVAAYKQLKTEWDEISGNIKKQNKFIEEHKTDFDNLNVSINNVNQANDFFVNQTDNFIESCQKRAEAMAALTLAEQNEEEKIKLKTENDDLSTKTVFRYRNKFKKGDKTLVTIGDYVKALKTLGRDVQAAAYKRSDANSGKILTAKSDNDILVVLAERFRAEREQREKNISIIDANNKRIADIDKKNKKLYQQINNANNTANEKNPYPHKDTTTGYTENTGKSEAERNYENQKRTNEMLENEKEALVEKQAELSQAILNNEEETAERQLSQIELDKKNQLKALDEWINELAKKRADVEKENWLNSKEGRTEQQWGSTENGQRSTEDWKQEIFKSNPEIAKVFNDLKDTINDTAAKATGKVYTEEKEKLENLLSAYQTYEQQREAIRKKYADERQKINEAKNPDGTPISEDTRTSALNVLAQKEQNEIKGVNDAEINEMRGSNEFLVNMFADTSSKSVKEIEKIIEKVRLLLTYMKAVKDENGTAIIKDKDGNTTRTITKEQVVQKTGISTEGLNTLSKSPDQLKTFTQQYDKLKSDVTKSNPFKALGTAIGDFFKKEEEGEGEQKSTGEKFKNLGSAAAEAAGGVGNFAGQLGDMFRAAGNDDAADAMESTEMAMNTISNIGQGFAQGGLIGGIAAAAGEALNYMTKAFQVSAEIAAENKKIKAELLAQEREYNLALLDELNTSKQLEGIFGTDSYGKAVNSMKAYKEALSGVNTALVGTNDQQNRFSKESYQYINNMSNSLARYVFLAGKIKKDGAYSEIKDLYSGLADIQVKTGVKRKGLFRKKDVYSSILDVYPELINAQGEFNKTLAETIINNRQMSDADKATLQNIIDLTEEYEEALQSVKDYLSGIFGDFGTTISDALVEAFEDGSSAALDFTDSVEEMLENLAKDMAYSLAIEPYLEEMQEQMLETMKSDTLSTEQKFKKYSEIMRNGTGKLTAGYEEALGFLESVKEAASESGYDIFTGGDDAETSQKKAYAQASEESIDALSGRMLANNEALYAINTLLSQTVAANIPAMSENITSMGDTLKSIQQSLQMQQDLRENSYIELQFIGRNTENATKNLLQMNLTIEKIRKKIEIL